jgi:hypothetical protein
VSGVLCAAFALVGAAFLTVPGVVLSFFDAWSARAGLATSAGEPAELYVVLAGAYMYLVTLLAWSMFRHPRDAGPARLLVHAKLASAVLSFGIFFLRQPHLVLLVNGVVDGAIGALVVLLLRLRRAPAARGATRPV